MTRQLVDAQYRVVEVTESGSEIYHGPYTKLGTAKGVRSQLKNGHARPHRRWYKWNVQGEPIDYSKHTYRLEHSVVVWEEIE